MELRYNMNAETGLPHICDHGVTEEEVEWVLAQPEVEWHGTEDSMIAVGRTESRKLLRIVYVPDEDRRAAFVITAYRLTGKALVTHNRYMRRKRK